MSAPPTLLIVRHGQTLWNVERRVLGQTDLSLDEAGILQAAGLPGAVGPVDAIWSSPLGRARQTAAPLASHLGLPIQIDRGLTEMDQGELEGLYDQELRERFGPLLTLWNADPHAVRLPGGETMGEVQSRALSAFQRIAETGAGQRIVVVTHQLVLASVVCALRGEPLTAWRSHTHRNTAWSEVVWTSPPTLVHEKVSEHLPKLP